MMKIGMMTFRQRRSVTLIRRRKTDSSLRSRNNSVTTNRNSISVSNIKNIGKAAINRVLTMAVIGMNLERSETKAE